MERGTNPQPIDWTAIGAAVEAVCLQAKNESHGLPAHIYVGGQGPLPVFIHIGYALQKFSGAQWIIGRKPKATSWELYPLADGTTGPDVLTASPSRDNQSLASGQLGLYLDTGGRPAIASAIQDAIERVGERVADVVEVRSTTDIVVEPQTTTALAAEVGAKISKIPALYPRTASLGLFVAGPTLFAFAIGRSINPSIVASIQLYNFSPGRYSAVYSLPFVGASRPSIPDDPASIEERKILCDKVVADIEALKTEVEEADLSDPLDVHQRSRFLEQLHRLTYRSADSDQFSLSIGSGTYSLGTGLLHALRDADDEVRSRFVKLLLLHELFHEEQGVRSTNYFDVGRAGVVLESIDFTADLFALRVLTQATLRAATLRSPHDVRNIVTQWIDAVLYGIQAFDLMEHGTRIANLPDRRLRRYLTWHLQRVRGEMVDTREQVAQLLQPSITAELAPVNARVDLRSDRIVLEATSSTEFFAAVGGRLVRHSRRPGFDPGELVDAVRGYNVVAIQKSMRFVVEENKSVFLPWR